MSPANTKAPLDSVPPWVPGQRSIQAADRNAVDDAVKRMAQRITPPAGVEGRVSESGSSLHPWSPDLAFLGLLMDAGPSGEADLDGAYYWVRSVHPIAQDGVDTIEDVEHYDASGGSPRHRWVKALSTSEFDAETHDLDVDTLVEVLPIWTWPATAGGARNLAWYFTVGTVGDPLPEGVGQYKVLQLDVNDNPLWDYVRAGP